ncbi:GNAT family N-acetyltransferase [Metabacillus fastidiosus]|uniref:GNAT family N-acetyltransferase n=1 Tax=Metabacillus fastidiosus TaxID=1458 RepID=A0ABU6P2I7_9BACI|nr:GNAT family N-acetyltransferase [Metabacillus fastidiosus]MED4403243.1 GNAT family N-acetyltransferase [Metabacillus fastidiosus]MED4461667.1 GNAT family N-acetyltransferase [Metabacillus fastidiosus]
MEIKIVTTDKQLEDAFNIRKIVFVEEQKVPVEEEIDQFENEADHLVLYDGEKPVGAARFRIVDEYGKLERICILKDYRNKGAGSLIMEYLEKLASQKGLNKLKLNAQTKAIPFYERFGYKTVSKLFMDAGIPHVTMTKII